MDAHPDFGKFAARLVAIGANFDAGFDGDLFRFIHPKFSKAADIVSGVGALHAAGRWNLPGASRLSYTALAPQTALAEALAHVNYYRLPVAQALPRVLVALRLKAKRVLDLRDGKARQALVLSQDTIRKLDWRAENQHGSEAMTQAWGRALADVGFEAVIVPSAAEAGGANVLVFPENLLAGSVFAVKEEVKWPAA
jgi:RES domain-containing protein